MHRRFDRFGHVSVVGHDRRAVSIPRHAKVVANLPFATRSALLAKLLDPPGSPRAGIDVLVERGFAIRGAARLPRSAQVAWWAARYDMRLVRVVAPTAFAPDAGPGLGSSATPGPTPTPPPHGFHREPGRRLREGH